MKARGIGPGMTVPAVLTFGMLLGNQGGHSLNIDYRELVSAMVWKFRGLTDEIHKSISWQTTAGDEHSIQKHKTTAGDEHSIQKRKTTAGDEHSIPKHSHPLCQDLSGTAK